MLLPPFATVEGRPSPPSSAIAAAASLHSILRANSSSLIVNSRLVPKKSKGLPFNPQPTFSALALRPLSVPIATLFSDDDPSSLSTAVGLQPNSPVFQWNLDRSLILLNFTACLTAVSAAWIFFSAIPALLAFKKAAVSSEKIFDVTTEELPDSMAEVRLSAMEISDLTMELSDLGQEIGLGARSSTRAVRVAEDRLRRLATTGSMITGLENSTQRNKSKTDGPKASETARLREGIVNMRAAFGVIYSLTQVSQWLIYFLRSREGNKSSRN